MKLTQKALLLLFFVLVTFSVSAQPPTFDDDVDDETDLPIAPINDHIALALAVGAAMGCYFITKQSQKQYK